MPLSEDLRPCTVCGEPVLWGTRHSHCGRRVLAAETTRAAAVRVIARLLAMHEHQSADDATAEAGRLLDRAIGVKTPVEGQQ